VYYLERRLQGADKAVLGRLSGEWRYAA